MTTLTTHNPQPQPTTYNPQPHNPQPTTHNHTDFSRVMQKHSATPGYNSSCFCIYNEVTDPVKLGTGIERDATLGDIVEYMYSLSHLCPQRRPLLRHHIDRGCTMTIVASIGQAMLFGAFLCDHVWHPRRTLPGPCLHQATHLPAQRPASKTSASSISLGVCRWIKSSPLNLLGTPM